jgi:signal transduction histidine kinase
MYARLQVVDTGVGMGPQTLQQAFEPFFTTKRDVDGAGLGLALVYGTVRQHGGFVSLVSQPGIGTTATVCLPAAPEEEAASGE